MLKVSYLLLPRFMLYGIGGVGVISESINSPALANAFTSPPRLEPGLTLPLRRKWP